MEGNMKVPKTYCIEVKAGAMPILSYVKGPSISAPVLISKIMNFIFSKNINNKGHKHVQFTFPFQVWKMISGI